MRGLAARFSSRVAPTGPASPARRSWPAKKQTYHAGAERRRRAAVKPRAPPPPLGEEFLGPVQPCASADRRLGLWWTEAEPPDGQLRAAPREGGRARGYSLTLRQTCSWPRPRAQFAFKDSMIHVQCRSHYVSHFAAFFIVARAKISVVESCLGFASRSRPTPPKGRRRPPAPVVSLQMESGRRQAARAVFVACCCE